MLNDSNLDPLGENQSILDSDIEIANRCLDLGKPEKDLSGARFARSDACRGRALSETILVRLTAPFRAPCGR